MSTILAMIREVQQTLLDDPGRPGGGEKNTSLAELRTYYNDGVRRVIALKPASSTVVVDFACVAGSRQDLATGDLELADVPRNATGKAITMVDREFMDREDPTWLSAAATANIDHVMYDKKVPTVFWTYPPASAAQALTITVVRIPATLESAANGDPCHLAQEYEFPIKCFMLHRVYAKNNVRGDTAKADRYLQMMKDDLAGRLQAAVANQGSSDGKSE